MNYTTVFIGGLLSSLASTSLAFSLDVREVHEYFKRNQEERSQIPFLDGNAPIHEQLTDQALKCGVAGSFCDRLANLGIRSDDIREGVRSNDFPAQYLDSNAAWWCKGRVLRITNDGHVGCILGSFAKASNNRDMFKKDAWARQRPFGMRGHFGDLQFLHAMAPLEQTAGATYDGIAMWMEFAYRASLDEFDLRTYADALPVKGMSQYFVRGSRRAGDLLNYRFDKATARGVALGQMLHIAQDSFAGCHVKRNSEGKVVRFLSYEKQTSSRHAEHDRDREKVEAALSGPLNPVKFAERLFELRLAGKGWEHVEPLVKEYFHPVDRGTRAEAGSHCK